MEGKYVVVFKDGTVDLPMKLAEQYIPWMAKSYKKHMEEKLGIDEGSFNRIPNTEDYAFAKHMQMIVDFMQQCLERGVKQIKWDIIGRGRDIVTNEKITEPEPWMIDFFNKYDLDDIDRSVPLSIDFNAGIYTCYANRFKRSPQGFAVLKKSLSLNS